MVYLYSHPIQHILNKMLTDIEKVHCFTHLAATHETQVKNQSQLRVSNPDLIFWGLGAGSV